MMVTLDGHSSNAAEIVKSSSELVEEFRNVIRVGKRYLQTKIDIENIEWDIERGVREWLSHCFIHNDQVHSIHVIHPFYL